MCCKTIMFGRRSGKASLPFGSGLVYLVSPPLTAFICPFALEVQKCVLRETGHPGPCLFTLFIDALSLQGLPVITAEPSTQ